MISFGKRCMQEPGEAVWKAVNHDMFLTVFFEVFALYGLEYQYMEFVHLLNCRSITSAARENH